MPDPSSGRPTGVLVAAHQLRDSNRISIDDEGWLRERLVYFNTHLKVPACLNEPKHRRAISWFKQGSKMIDRIWDIVYLMEEYDIFIDVLNSKDPGYTIYEDGHQLVARPYQK